MAMGKLKEDLERILSEGEQLAEVLRRRKIRKAFLRYIEYPTHCTHLEAKIDKYYNTIYTGYLDLDVAITELEKKVDTEREAYKLYDAIKSGLKRIATGRMRITDLGSRNWLEPYDPKNYIVGLEAMERLAKKYQIKSFEKDMRYFRKLTLWRLRIGCREAMPIGKWLKEKGYIF